MINKKRFLRTVISLTCIVTLASSNLTVLATAPSGELKKQTSNLENETSETMERINKKTTGTISCNIYTDNGTRNTIATPPNTIREIRKKTNSEIAAANG